MTRLLLIFLGFSSAFASAGDKKSLNAKELQKTQQKKLSNDQESKNSITLSLANGVTSAALINRFFSFVPKNPTNAYWSDLTTILCRPEIALPEAVLATASVVVDVKPSTANTIVGWGNVIWGGIKLALYFTGDPLTNSITTAFYFSTIATNGANAVYRLWYAKKNADPIKQ